MALFLASALGSGLAQAEGWELQVPWPTSDEIKGIHMFGPQEAWMVSSPMLSNNTGSVLHTVDGGETWEKTILQTSSINSIFFIDDQTGWIVGNNTWRTTNGGMSWTKLNDWGSLYDVFFLDAQRGWACGNGSVAYWTTNGGANWNAVGPIAGHTLSSIQFLDANNGWTCDIAGKLFRSTDGGRSWNLNFSAPQGSSFNTVQFFDSQEGWVIGGDTFYKTTDGGATWIQKPVPPTTWTFGADFAPDRLTGVAVGYFGNVIRTTDGGESWSIISPTGPRPSIYAVRMFDSQHGFYVGEKAMLYYTTDGGATWSQKGNTGWAMTHGMYALDDNRAWAACEAGEIMRTTNGGRHWERVFVPGIDIYGKCQDVSFYDENYGFAVGKHEEFGYVDMKFLRSTDGGVNWQVRAVFHTPQDIKSVDTVGPETAIVLGVNDWTNDGLNITTDAGLTWTGISPAGAGFIGNIDFLDGQLGWIAGNRIYRTTNGGTSWTLQYTPPDHCINISMFNEQIGWAVGAWGAIYHTTNGGSTWLPQNSGTNESIWGVSAVSPTECWAAILPGRSLHTTDGGATWIEEVIQDDGITNFETIAFSSSGHGWIAGNFGIWHHRGETSGVPSGPVDGGAPRLFPASPNPFRTETSIRFELPRAAAAVLRVFDVRGRVVATPIDRVLPAGRHSFRIDGEHLPAGVYLYRLEAGDRSESGRVVRVR